MFRKTWDGLSVRTRRHLIAAVVGFVVGAVFGGRVFVVVELAIGNFWDELIFGIAGAAAASILYELATMGRSSR